MPHSLLSHPASAYTNLTRKWMTRSSSSSQPNSFPHLKGETPVRIHHHLSLALSLLFILSLALLAGISLPALASPGDVTLVINEVDADQTGTDNAEFVELYDGGAGNTSLAGYTLVFFNGNGDVSYFAFDLDAWSTNPDGYFTLCGDAANVPSCSVEIGPGTTNLIQNGADAVALYRADDADFPAGTPVSATNLIDAIVYDTNDDDDAELLAILTPGQPQINEGGKGDKDNDSNQRCPNGSGDPLVTTTYDQFPPTPGAENTCPSNIALIINEVDADQTGTDNAEFVELYDGGAGNTSLAGYTLVFFNGNGDVSYFAFDLDAWSTNPDGYFTLCGDAANVPSCSVEIGPGTTNLIQNGADAVALYRADDADFPAGTPVSATNLIDAIVYDTNDDDDAELLAILTPGQPQVNEGGKGDKDNDSNQRCPNGSGDPLVTTTYDQFPPTPGAENTCGPVTGPFGVCGDPATPIHDVQGDGFASPMTGATGVILEGVVVGDFQGGDGLGGYFLQEEDADADADANTSEGIFVYDNGFMDTAVGDVVRVMGDVQESYDLTRLSSITNMAICTPADMPAPATVTGPVNSLADWERYEGMSIILDAELTVADNYTWGRYGEVGLAFGGLVWNPTELVAPGADALQLQAENDWRRIQLDDGSTVQNPPPLPPYNGLDNTLRVGDVVSNVHGVLSYGFGVYEVHPTADVEFQRRNERPDQAPDVGGSLVVGAFNTLNYFSTIDTGASVCGPLADQDCRGADSASEFQRQQDKLVSAILGSGADILGLMEIENHATDAAINTLVLALNNAAGADIYAAIATGPIGGDAIKVALLYKPDSVTPVGDYAILDSSVDAAFLDNYNRPVLAQTFEENASGERFTVAVKPSQIEGV
jgi:hypothetical protein